MWEWEEYPGIVSQSRGRLVLWSQDYARTFQREENKFLFVGGGRLVVEKNSTGQVSIY